MIVLKIGPEPSVNERSIETPKTTPKLDSTTANHHKTSYHMRGSRKFSLWVGRADGFTKFTITKIVWQIEGGLNPLSSPLWNHPCQHAVILATVSESHPAQETLAILNVY